MYTVGIILSLLTLCKIVKDIKLGIAILTIDKRIVYAETKQRYTTVARNWKSVLSPRV